MPRRFDSSIPLNLTAKARSREVDGRLGWASKLKALSLFDSWTFWRFNLASWRLGCSIPLLLTAKARSREVDGRLGWASKLKALSLFDSWTFWRFNLTSWRLGCSITLLLTAKARIREVATRLSSALKLKALSLFDSWTFWRFNLASWRLGCSIPLLLTAKARRREVDGRLGWASKLKALSLFDSWTFWRFNLASWRFGCSIPLLLTAKARRREVDGRLGWASKLKALSLLGFWTFWRFNLSSSLFNPPSLGLDSPARHGHARDMKSLHRSLCLSLIIAVFSPLPVRAHSAVEPVPKSDMGWKDRQDLLSKRAGEAGEKAQVIFIGDSITQGWEGAGKEVWAKYYAHRNAVNLGIGGDRTQHVLWRFDHGNLDGLKPKAAVIMIGTNNSNGEDNTVDKIADGVTAIVKKLRAKLPQTKVLLLAIFPRSESPCPQRGKILQVNQIIEKLADDQNVFWIDFGYKFVNSDGTIPRDLMPDYLHLSRKGYEIWAESIEEKLAAILG